MKEILHLYKEEWIRFKTRYLKLFLLALLLFFVVAVVSYAVLLGRPEFTEQKFIELAERLMAKVPLDKGLLMTAVGILISNFTAVCLVVGLGIIPFLFLPAFGVSLNGGAMGVLTAFLTIRGVDLGPVLLYGLLPHGIFEIPAFLYAATLGIGLCLGMTRFILKEFFGRGGTADQSQPGDPVSPEKNPYRSSSTESFADLWRHTLRSFALVIVPLLLLAAAIEAFITPALIRTFIGNLDLL